jgi:hypothetical protein
VHVSFREFAVKKRMRAYARRFLGKGGLFGQSSGSALGAVEGDILLRSIEAEHIPHESGLVQRRFQEKAAEAPL